MLNNTRNIRGQPCPARDYEISRKGTNFYPFPQILPQQIHKSRPRNADRGGCVAEDIVYRNEPVQMAWKLTWQELPRAHPLLRAWL